MKRWTGVPGLAAVALFVSASGAEAQAPWPEVPLFGAAPGCAMHIVSSAVP